MGKGLFELRCKGSEGIGRAFYCTLVGKEIVILHSFIKKTQETPLADLAVARKRPKEVKMANDPYNPVRLDSKQAIAEARSRPGFTEDKHFPLFATLKKYANACGKKIVVQLV